MIDPFLSSSLKKTFTKFAYSEIDFITALARHSKSESLVRHFVLGTLSILGAIYFAMWFPVFWFVAYISCSTLAQHYYVLLGKTRSLTTYMCVLTAVLARLIVFRVMLLYMWHYPHPAANYISVFMLLAAVGFSVNFRSRLRSFMVLQVLTDVVVILSLAVQFLWFMEELEGAFLVTLSAVSLVIYMVVSLFQHMAYISDLELVEEQNRQALKMEAVGRLTGGVAHDFNNILTVVLGNLELHDEIDDPEERRELRHKTRDAAKRAAELTSQLLAFSRKSTLSKEVHDIHAVFKRVRNMTERLLPTNIALEIDVSPETQAIRADATQLEVGLLNLIINARDAMPNGGTILLNATSKPGSTFCETLPDAPYVSISVSDEGGGIPAEIIDKVTEPFFTTKPIGEGSGLGLSMVKGFAEQSGGGLFITTVPQKSTTVNLCMPAAANSSENSE